MIMILDLRGVDQEWYRINGYSWKVPCIKSVRQLGSCSLREAKDIVEQAISVPTQFDVRKMDHAAISKIKSLGGKVNDADGLKETYLEPIRELLTIATLKEDTLMEYYLKEMIDFLGGLEDGDQDGDTG